MTRDDLKEGVALAIAVRHGHDKEGLARSPSTQRIFDYDALAALSVIVPFVAEWISDFGEDGGGRSLTAGMASQWRKDMEAQS